MSSSSSSREPSNVDVSKEKFKGEIEAFTDCSLEYFNHLKEEIKQVLESLSPKLLKSLADCCEPGLDAYHIVSVKKAGKIYKIDLGDIADSEPDQNDNDKEQLKKIGKIT
jgi:hypothetical protein